MVLLAWSALQAWAPLALEAAQQRYGLPVGDARPSSVQEDVETLAARLESCTAAASLAAKLPASAAPGENGSSSSRLADAAGGGATEASSDSAALHGGKGSERDGDGYNYAVFVGQVLVAIGGITRFF
eukprot:TRINITY_DN6479_c0_g1_i5.p3 TRINITY_DN6479_c0_g1~~TRINITY_DN6479_c0_g1_i5.p3  ORF type:complete len:128 (-),score=41.90 TRINITY_DN6479_c0_g1_i5:137-520(-)